MEDTIEDTPIEPMDTISVPPSPLKRRNDRENANTDASTAAFNVNELNQMENEEGQLNLDHESKVDTKGAAPAVEISTAQDNSSTDMNTESPSGRQPSPRNEYNSQNEVNIQKLADIQVEIFARNYELFLVTQIVLTLIGSNRRCSRRCWYQHQR